MSRWPPRAAAAVCAAAVLLGGCADVGASGGADGPGTADAGDAPAAAAAPSPAGDTSAGRPYRSGLVLPPIATRGARLADQVSVPVVAPSVLTIPAIGVSGAIAGVGVDGNGELAVPPAAAALSWYELGPSPGSAGSAVVAGHVDYDGSRGVFWDLRRVAIGDAVEVALADGTARAFRVETVQELAKQDLPTAELFATAGPPRLVLITCGGSFDRSARSYRSNIVVTAVPA